MGWDGMEWDGMGWDGMRWGGIGRDRVRRDGMMGCYAMGNEERGEGGSRQVKAGFDVTVWGGDGLCGRQRSKSLKDVFEGATLAQLHDDPDLLRSPERSDKVDDVCVPKGSHQIDFALKLFLHALR